MVHGRKECKYGSNQTWPPPSFSDFIVPQREGGILLLHCRQDWVKQHEGHLAPWTTPASKLAREQGKNNRYFSEQFLAEKWIYVHADEEKKNGSVTAMDLHSGEEPWLWEQEHRFNSCSAMHSPTRTADGRSRCDYSRGLRVSVHRGHRVEVLFPCR